MYVPDVPELRTKLLREAHDAAAAGHLGHAKTLEVLSRAFWWPDIARNVREYVHTCDACQRHTPLNQRRPGLLQPLPVPEQRWEVVTVDFVCGLPLTRRKHNAILVFVDKLTKMIHIAATRTDVTAEGTARLLFDNSSDCTVDPVFSSRTVMCVLQVCSGRNYSGCVVRGSV